MQRITKYLKYFLTCLAINALVTCEAIKYVCTETPLIINTKVNTS